MLNIFYFEISITFSYIICLDLLDLLINLCAYLLTHYVIYLFVFFNEPWYWLGKYLGKTLLCSYHQYISSVLLPSLFRHTIR